MTFDELTEAMKKQGEEIERLRIVVAELVERVAEGHRQADDADEWLRRFAERRKGTRCDCRGNVSGGCAGVDSGDELLTPVW